ncbi:MAG: hypothetical protein VB078_04650 [Clostridiaceae bacterium]|nr:hypothetical protein [Clostridiaceae bacterium]
MNGISSARLTAPKASVGEIVRQSIIDSVLACSKALIYIHAGPGYGKTTLMSQLASLSDNPVWLTMAGESDPFEFADSFCKAICHAIPDYEFAVSEFIPFSDNENFIVILANALISSVESLGKNIDFFLDDIHTITDQKTKELIACFLKYTPAGIRFLLGSREEKWQELMPLYLKGKLLEIQQNELAFSKEETVQLTGLDEDDIYDITEGWPLAVNSFKVLLENGASPSLAAYKGKQALYSYLFYECINRMSSEIVDFLNATACFEELDPQMLDKVMNRKNTRLVLDSLVSRNIFITKTVNGYYRYHALFRTCLLEAGNTAQHLVLRQKAGLYYFEAKDYSKAVEYALILNDKNLLKKIILASYRDLLKTGNYNELRLWFNALGDEMVLTCPELLLAKGSFLSSMGNFIEAKECLDNAIPSLEPQDKALFTEAMVHKARVLRNYISFEESNKLLDELLLKLDTPVSETGYSIVIEKLYNLCWNSQIDEAFNLGQRIIEECSRAGNLKIKSWFERYMSAISFFKGDMSMSVYYYERSLELPEAEREHLDIHSIGIYAAKAYQMLGKNERALTVLSEELRKMRTGGKYEEMWSAYLFAAEIHYQNTSIDIANGKNASYDVTKKYFELSNEYAPLFRKTEFQMQWAKLLKLTYSLMFSDLPKEKILNEIAAEYPVAGDYLKSIILARMFGYFAATHDYSSAAACAKKCIEVGINSKTYLHSTVAYGILARIALAREEYKEAAQYTGQYLRLCHQNGIYEYFNARKDYDPILQFADSNGIEKDITKIMMDFCGYKTKKAYIKTFGGFAVLACGQMQKPLKMRTKRERELLAFLLSAGTQGVTKEQICDAVWPDTESNNTKKLIGVYLANINKDLAAIGIESCIVCQNRRYIVSRAEIECDFELFEKVAERYKRDKSLSDGQQLLDLYEGEYLSDFEAYWATARRIKYQGIYDEVAINMKNMTKS